MNQCSLQHLQDLCLILGMSMPGIGITLCFSQYLFIPSWLPFTISAPFCGRVCNGSGVENRVPLSYGHSYVPVLSLYTQRIWLYPFDKILVDLISLVTQQFLFVFFQSCLPLLFTFVWGKQLGQATVLSPLPNFLFLKQPFIARQWSWDLNLGLSD